MSHSAPTRPPLQPWKWLAVPDKNTLAISPSRPSAARVLVQVMVPVCVAGVFFLLRRPIVGWIVLGMATWMLISGLLLPRVFLAMERGLKAVGRAVGGCLTKLLLGAFFFLCFLPLSLFVRREARAQLALRWEKDTASYWQNRHPVDDLAHFLRQY